MNEQTQYFYELTPERILAAVETLGLKTTGRVMALNSFENRVYDVEIELDDDGTPARLQDPSARFRIVKFYRPGRWTKEQILEEHTFLLDLKEYEIPVVAPLEFSPGETLRKLPDADIWCAIFPKMGGRSPDELTNEQLPQIGRLLARLHNVGGIRKAEHRMELTTDTYGLDNLDYLLETDALPPEIRPRYQRVVEEICDITAPWFDSVHTQRVHGDCHLGNLLWGREGPFWVDFDDMVIAPCVQDLWLMLPGRDDYARAQRDILLEAYEQMRPFEWNSLRLIEPLRALRMIHFDAWIARRYSDPAFPRAFPEFGTSRHWNSQVQALEEQLLLIQDS